MTQHPATGLRRPAFRLAWGAVSAVLCGVSRVMAGDVAAKLALGPPVADLDSPCDIVVTSRGSGESLVCIEGQQHVATSAVELVLLLSTLLPALLMERRGVSRRIHAAGVRWGEGVILVAGEGRSGKSSLALEAWLRGYDLLGDDWLLFSDDFSGVLPVPKPLKVRMTQPQFAAKASPALRRVSSFGSLFGETRVLIGRDSGFYNAWEHPLPVCALVFLADPTEAGAPMERMSVAEALPLLMAQTILCKNSKTLSGVAFARVLAARNIPVFVFRRGIMDPFALFNAVLGAVSAGSQAPRINLASNKS